ncbi:hypothetical protein TNCV_4506271, partial [Trichonephila clavipes]
MGTRKDQLLYPHRDKRTVPSSVASKNHNLRQEISSQGTESIAGPSNQQSRYTWQLRPPTEEEQARSKWFSLTRPGWPGRHIA